MTLEYSVDGVDFDRLVADAQRGIAARSRGRWTLHAPVDPGMTLIELYGWLLDQRSYVADQLSEPMVHALLKLLGQELRPARPAGTVLELEPDVGHARVLRARTTAAVIGRPDLVFSTRHRLSVAALDRSATPAPIEVRTWEGDRTLDLARREPIWLLGGRGTTSTARIVVRFAESPPASAPVGLLLELATPEAVLPAWSPDAVAVPPPTALTWWCQWRGPNGGPFDGDVEDGTGGLRRSGIVRLRAPSVPCDRVELTVQARDATFTSPPELRRIAANAVLADHRSWPRHTEDAEWLPLPGRTIELWTGRGLPLPGVRVRMAEHDGKVYAWRPVASLAPQGPTDRVFVVDRTRARLVFGDGLTGRLPRRAANAPVVVKVPVGGGRGGNIGPSTWELTARLPDAPAVHSRVDAIGGRDAEAIDEGIARVAAELGEVTRAVIADDYQRLATSTPGVAVARAHAAIDHDPAVPCRRSPGVVTVFVVPGVEPRSAEQVRTGEALAAPVADPGLLAAVRTRLTAARLVGTRIEVVSARYLAVRVEITVASDPWDADELRRRVAGAVRVFLDPLLGGAADEPGGARPGWPFGAAIEPTDLLREVQAELRGEGQVAAVRLARDGESVVEECEALLVPPHALVSVARVDVRIATPRPGRAEGLR